MTLILIVSLLSVASLLFVSFFLFMTQVKKEVIHNTKVEGELINQRFCTKEMSGNSLGLNERERLRKDWYHSINL